MESMVFKETRLNWSLLLENYGASKVLPKMNDVIDMVSEIRHQENKKHASDDENDII